MARQFRTHYSLDEARALLPRIRRWLVQLAGARASIQRYDRRLGRLLTSGRDLGGPGVKAWLEALATLQEALHEFRAREIQLKDPDRGLVDFPAFMGDREIFLCWEQSEEDIGFWHDLESGYAGRQKL
jgi:hypothetical protein